MKGVIPSIYFSKKTVFLVSTVMEKNKKPHEI